MSTDGAQHDLSQLSNQQLRDLYIKTFARLQKVNEEVVALKQGVEAMGADVQKTEDQIDIAHTLEKISNIQ